jgi:hypothetical protein
MLHMPFQQVSNIPVDRHAFARSVSGNALVEPWFPDDADDRRWACIDSA